MPLAPPRHRPPGMPTAGQATATRRAIFDAKRPSAGERGYDADWRRCRRLFIEKHPTCAHPGCGRTTEQVDHIVSVKERPDLRLSWSNLRPFCASHHSQRTFHDQGSQFGRGVTHPEWLQPSLVPVTMVCGPAGSGKSTWVRQHAGPHDLIIDLDVIMCSLAGTPLHCAPHRWLDQALRERNARLGTLSRSKAWPAAWLIVGEPKAQWRQWWCDKLKPISIVVLETQASVCFDRIYADPQRPADIKARHCDFVVAWWGSHQRRDGDVVIVDRL